MKIFLSNWELKVLAVLAALIFWVLVIGTENTFYTFPNEIQIKPFNISEDMVVAGDIGKVKLTLKMHSSDALKTLVADDFNAYVDLQGLREGELEVAVLVSSKRPDVSVVRVEPSRINIKIEKREEKEFNLDYIVKGALKEGFIVKEVLLAHDKVKFKSAQSILNSIYAATVVIELEGESRDIKKIFPITIIDEAGNEITNVSSDISSVEAEIKIAAVAGQKIVGVKPDIKGSPSENLWIKSITAEPSFVVLNGPSDALQQIEYAVTTEIDVQDLKESGTYYTMITGLPNNVSLEGGAEVKVVIEVAGYSSPDSALKRKTVNLPVVVRKFKAPQANHTIDTRSVTLVAEGLEEDLEKITSKLQIELDITDAEENKKEFILDRSYINLPDGIAVVSITPAKVTVTW